MENSGSFSLESNLPKSFFSSFSSNLSLNSTWKPILTSLQENQRLSRLIQVRESKLQELSTNHLSTKSQFISQPYSEDFPFAESDRLTEILALSQKNLKVLSFKIGLVPKNLLKAMDLVLKDPSSMLPGEKFECLSGIELLREKLSDLILNSDEILSFFKDIALECEATGSSFKFSQETLLRFADKREEIFVSKELNRVKIQNLYRLVMNLESWKCRKGVFVEEFDSNSRIKYEDCVKETLEELGKKEQELRNVQEYYREKIQGLDRKVKGLAAGLKKLRHCVEFELFSSWTALVGNEFSNEPSCSMIIKKVGKYQEGVKMKNFEVLKRFQCFKEVDREGISKEIENVKEFFREKGLVLGEMCQKLIEVNRKVEKELVESRNECESMGKMIKDYKNKVLEHEQKEKMMKKYLKDKVFEIISGLKADFHETKGRYLEFIEANQQLFSQFCRIVGVADKLQVIKADFNTIKTNTKRELTEYIKDQNKTVALRVEGIYKTLNLSVLDLKKEFSIEKYEIKGILSDYWKFMEIELLKLIKNSEELKVELEINKNVNRIKQLDLTQEIDKLKKEICVLKEKQVFETENFEQFRVSIQKELKENIEQKTDLLKEIEEVTVNFKVSDRQIIEKNDKIEECQSIMQDLAFTLESNSKKLKENNDFIQELQSSLDQSKLKVAELTKKYSESENSLKSLSESLSSKDLELKTAFNSLSNCEKQLECSLSTQKSQENSLKSLSESLLSKDLELKSTFNYLSNCEKQLECSLSAHKSQNLLINSLSSSLSKAKHLITTLKSLQPDLRNLFKTVASQKSETFEDFETLKSLISNTSQSQQDLSFQLASLQSSYSHLQSSNNNLFSQIQDLKSQNQLYLCKNKELKTKFISKLAKLKRKVRSFNMVLGHEKVVVKKTHQEVFEYLKRALEGLKSFVEGNEEGKNVDETQLKVTYAELSKVNQLKIAELEAERSSFAQLNSMNQLKIAELEAEKENLATSCSLSQLKIAELEAEKEKYAQLSSINQQRITELEAEKENFSQLSPLNLQKMNELEAEKEKYAKLSSLNQLKIAELEADKEKFNKLSSTSGLKVPELEAEIVNLKNSQKDLTEKFQRTEDLNKNLESLIQQLQSSENSLKSELESSKTNSIATEQALTSSLTSLKTLKSKLAIPLKAITSFRDLNNTLRSSVTKLLQSSTFEIEGFRIKLFEQVKNDIGKIRKNLEFLMENYKEERNLVHEKIEKIKETVDLDREAIEPVKGYLKDNQENIEALNETFERNSVLAQKNIEENVKKLEDVCCKIEGFRVRGYELLNKYSKDSETDLFDQVSEISENFSVDASDHNLSSVIFEDELKNSVTNNELLKMYNPSVKSCCRLPYLIKSLEKILNNKFKDDLALLAKNKEPLSMSEYLYNSLYKESPALAEKKICELLNSFRENQTDSRVKFYCRLFQVFEPNPISYKLSLYIIKMRHFFNLFIGKQVIPESHKKRVDKMQVTVILKTTRKLFNSDVETGKVVLKNLKPENMIGTVWSITCIDYYLYSKSLTPGDCFKTITQQQTITEEEFVYGLSKVHDTFVNENDLHDLFNSQSTGLMAVEELTKLFDLDTFFKRNQTYMVDQLQFLNALIEGYTAMRIRHYKEVENIIIKKCGKKQILGKPDVASVLNDLNANFNLEKIFEKTEEISARDLKKKIFELNIGGKGIGCYNLKSIGGISDVFED